MQLAPYYREFELPWEGDEEASARFRKILRVLLILLLLLASCSWCCRRRRRRPPRTSRSAWRG